MLKSITSLTLFALAITFITTIQGCSKYSDSGSLSKPEPYSRGTVIWGGSHSGRGPGGRGVK